MLQDVIVSIINYLQLVRYNLYLHVNLSLNPITEKPLLEFTHFHTGFVHNFKLLKSF